MTNSHISMGLHALRQSFLILAAFAGLAAIPAKAADDLPDQVQTAIDEVQEARGTVSDLHRHLGSARAAENNKAAATTQTRLTAAKGKLQEAINRLRSVGNAWLRVDRDAVQASIVRLRLTRAAGNAEAVAADQVIVKEALAQLAADRSKIRSVLRQVNGGGH